MATPSTVLRESMGSKTLIVATFSSLTIGETYDSGLGTNVVKYWINDPSAGQSWVSHSSGTFTFELTGTSTNLDLFIMADA